jgi:hypothetical protein
MVAKFTGVTSTAAQAARKVLQKRLSDIDIIKELWEEAGKTARKAPDFSTAKAARTTFNNHRDRFWARVKQNPKAKQLFEEAGLPGDDVVSRRILGLD